MPTPAQRLIHAVRTQNYERVNKLVRRGIDPNARSVAGRTALHAAAEEGDREAARILIEAGADVNARMHDSKTPLHLAAAYGGACDLSDPDFDRRDPCRRNRHHPINTQVAKSIYEIIKTRNRQLPTELDVQDQLAEENKAEILLACLETFADPKQLYREIKARGIDIDQVDPHFTELLLGKPRFLCITELLLDSGADIHALDESGGSVLQGAVVFGRSEMIELLLMRGANPNPRSSSDEPHESLVETALERSKTGVAELLITHGVRFNPRREILHEAAGNGREEVVKWLLNHETEIDLRDEDGNTALFAAARSGHDSLVALLVARGANVRLRNARGAGILHMAAGWDRCLEHVAGLGLPIDEPDQDGKTALHCAAHCGNRPSTRVLLSNGASINLRDTNGNTPLHCLFLSDEFRPDVEFPAFHALVSAAADRSVKNCGGKTAFDMATEYRYPEEYLKLLEPPAETTNPGQFLWLGEKEYAGLLPRAMKAFTLDDAEWPSAEHYFHAQKRETLRNANGFDWRNRCTQRFLACGSCRLGLQLSGRIVAMP